MRSIAASRAGRASIGEIVLGPEGARQISPGQRPGSANDQESLQALKGRNNRPEAACCALSGLASFPRIPFPRALPWADLSGPFGANANCGLLRGNNSAPGASN